MLVPSAEKMLASLYRVLQKGGRISLSVWGDKKRMKYFTFTGPIFRKHGIKLPI